MACDCADRQAIIDVLNTYAMYLDARDWQGLTNVFHREASADYGGAVTGRSTIIDTIRSFLGGCGPSQHLLGNYQIAIDGDHAESSTKARVLHIGAGERAKLTPYEAIGAYRDRLIRTAEGWRILYRHFDVQITLGDFNVLGPG